MRKGRKDPIREERIYNDAIVDATPDEQAMSWYCYLQERITFPFRAKCIAVNKVSPLMKGESIDVVGMAAEDACDHDMLVRIRWKGRRMAVPLSQFAPIDPDESTAEAVGDWHYWLSQGCIL